jgi:hypothetical protein
VTLKRDEIRSIQGRTLDSPPVTIKRFEVGGGEVIHRHIIVREDDRKKLMKVLLQLFLGHNVGHSLVLSQTVQKSSQILDVNAAFGWQDADYTETQILSTKLCEDEIVHGVRNSWHVLSSKLGN